MSESRLEMATRHVATGQRIVDGQRLLLEHLKAGGRPFREAERLLALFEASLRIFEDDLESIIARQSK